MTRRKVFYSDFEKTGDLAELIGVTLGDGHICCFPRTESLSLFSNADDIGFIDRYKNLIQKIFLKVPTISKKSDSHCIKINIYQKDISKRLSIPSGARIHKKIIVPAWIEESVPYTKRYLRGLYEAEGSFCVHKPTYTYKFLFSNVNRYMLNNVCRLMKNLGFHPYITKDQVQIARKEEVYRAMDMIGFRQY